VADIRCQTLISVPATQLPVQWKGQEVLWRGQALVYGAEAGVVDISDRAISISGSYGRQRGLNEFGSGSCAVRVEADAGFLAPGQSRARYTAADIQGQRVRILLSLEPPTQGEPLSWRGEQVTWLAEPVLWGDGVERRVQRWSLFEGQVDSVRWQQQEQAAVASIRVVDDFVRMAANRLELADLPAEATDARLGRILDAAGYEASRRELDAGTVRCLAAESLEGRALELVQRVAATEGGRASIVHGQTGLDVNLKSRLRFFARGYRGPVVASVSDRPDADQLRFARQPSALSDSRLLVTSTSFADGAGTVHDAQDDAGVAIYGVREIRRSTFSSADDTVSVAAWWRSVFGEPLDRVEDVHIAAHIESDRQAQQALGLTVGDTMQVTLQQSAEAETAEYAVDGVEFQLSSLDMRSNLVRLDYRFRLLPPEAASFWELGSGALGDTARLAPSALLPDNPLAGAGWKVWETGQPVTALDFTSKVAAQRVVLSSSAESLGADEPAPQTGAFNLTADDLVLRVYTAADGWQAVGQSV